MDINIRQAGPEDADFIAWVMLAAARSHVERGIWEVMTGGTEEDCLAYLRVVAATEVPHLFHSSTFIIAEVDGVPAAALSGYNPQELGMDAYMQAFPEVIGKMGWDDTETAAAIGRVTPCTTCFPDNAEGAWVVENVATVPEFRRKGLIDKLLNEMIDKGRKQDFRLAQIGVYIGNTKAQNAYEKAGFKIVDEKRHPDFEAAIGCPGIKRLLQDI